MGLISRLLDILPSANGVHPEPPASCGCYESAIAEHMENLSFFDLIKCGVCFKPWSEHSSECSQHHKRDHRLELLEHCKHLPKYKGDLISARVNGHAD